MRYTPSGQGVTSFSVASNRRYRTAAGEQREETEWFNVSAWGRLAEICNQYLTRGQQVYVEGRLRSRSYQGSDGQPRFSLEITLTEMQMLGSRGSGMEEDRSPYGNEGGRGVSDYGGGYGGGYGGQRDEIDDLPF